jgi:hypothetical protein
MLSTGQINLIQNENLKAMTFGYYSIDFSTFHQNIKTAPYREFIRGHTPVFIQDAVKAQCGDIVFEIANTFAGKLPPTCNLNLPDQNLLEAAILIRSLPLMKFNLQFQIAVNDTKTFNYHNTAKESKKLMAAIKEQQL